MTKTVLVAVDWGTTNVRAYCLDSQGHILEKRVSPQGVLSVTDFPAVLSTLLNTWASVPVMLCGMVGSTRGWANVPYMHCPVTLSALSHSLFEVIPRHYIVPGLQYNDVLHADVMRGEETQLLGAGFDGIFCLPGTHSKWAAVREQTIQSFTTFMTGELFNLLTHHGILVTANQVDDDAAFLAGVADAQSGEALSALLFHGRSKVLANRLSASSVNSFISGILIGAELQQALHMTNNDTVYLVAEEHLAVRYQHALNFLQRASIVLDAEAVTVAGLWRLAEEGNVI